MSESKNESNEVQDPAEPYEADQEVETTEQPEPDEQVVEEQSFED